MDIELLKSKLENIERQFNEQASIKSNAETEQVRLQGEYRLVKELIDAETKDSEPEANE